VVTVLLGVFAGACDHNHPPISASSSAAAAAETSTPPATDAVMSTTATPMTTTTSTTPSTVGLAACREGQLQIRPKGIQGATGNWAGAYWVADTSPQACVLQSPVKVNLLNGTGGVQLSATSSSPSLRLSGDTPMPADNIVSSGQLAYVSLFWPTDGSFAGGRCPTPDFIPAAIEITFGNSGPTTVSNIPVDGREVAICGQHMSVSVGPLGPD